MQVSILGPLEVRSANGELIVVTGARVRTLLARLAVDVGRSVPTHVLVADVWVGDPPADPANALQTLVSRLRRTLGDPQLVTQGAGGYRLELPADDVDAAHLERLLARARRCADPTERNALLQQATGLARAAAVPELDASHGDRLDELVVSAEEQALDAALEVDPADPDVARRAEQLVRDHPLREHFTEQLMRALQQQGRTAEALAAYERTRSYLADTLGADPGPELRRLHLELLQEAPVEPRPTRRTNLRAALTTFLGRDDETKRLHGLLEEGRLATIVGPGGAGKTRLAGVVAADWVDRLPEGVWFVELAPVTDAASLPQAVLGSLGLRATEVLERRQERGAVPTMDRLIDALAEARCLLVIDNCEHLVAAVAELVDQLLAECPELRVLATSREPLGIDGESLCLLPPLTLPAPNADAATALRHASVQLFSDRAAAADAGFSVDATTVGHVVEIVRRLDGLPLAIELAAARLRVLPVAEVAARLNDRFRLLTGGSRTAMPRHRTLRAVVEWSWDLLSPAERALAERLAVFPSGATVEAARDVGRTAGLEPDDVADLLDSLVDKSLLRLDTAGGLRYRMLETIREFGVERLAVQGVVDEVRQAHALHYAALVRTAEPWLLRAEQVSWLRRLEAEQDNIVAALQYLGSSGHTAAAVDLVTSLGLYWTLLGSHTEASTWLRYALSLPGESDPRRRLVAEAMMALNSLANGMQTDDVARPIAEQEMDDLAARLDALGDDVDDEPQLVLLRPMLGFFQGGGERMYQLFERSLAVADEWTTGALIMLRANMAENDGDLAAMRRDCAESLAIFTRLGERWGLASCLSATAQLHALDGEVDAAIHDYTEAMRNLVEFGATADLGMIRARLADLCLRQGDIAGAREHWRQMSVDDLAATSRSQRVMADSVLAAILRQENDVPGMRRQRTRLRVELAELGTVHPLGGHLRSMVLTEIAAVELALADLDAAAASLADAYPTAVGTRDMPIVASVGAMTATWAAAAGHPAHAARMLGAAAAVQGRLDEDDVDVRALSGRLRAELGPEAYAAALAEGFALDRPAAVALLDPRTVPTRVIHA